ncbi:hypothetical protein [Moorena sp. SIO3H5]|uniref:hypothetical protein n=1 Tax=Moorena sp. SIO3H5 TaxID=2607834 RepID=UPI0013BE2293|nr:hypothetical protein [Moorena sp. SIO3H5]NEO73429.1 hypothetical protein [Moorena sp. SIO3H5]
MISAVEFSSNKVHLTFLPYSLLPTPCSLFPVPCSLNKKNSVKFWLIPILDRIIFCNSQDP